MADTIMQGSTPTHTFNTPYPKNVLEKVIVTYKQGEVIVVEKSTEDLTIEDYSIKVELSQKDTLAFDPGNIVCIQLKVKTMEGKVIPSNKLYKNVEEVLNKEIF